MNVITAYIDQINKSGGINGRKIDLIALDDGYETDRTVANSKKLIEENKVFALLQYYGSSPTTQAMNDVFGPAKVPLVGTISGAGTLRKPVKDNPNNRYMFNVRASYADETEAIVNQLVGLGLKNIAVFYQNDAYGKAGLSGVTKALTARQLKPTAEATVERMARDKQQIPGVGHPIHKPIDPRTPRLFAIAQAQGFHGDYIALLQLIARTGEQRLNRPLPINATGAIGAICCEMGIPWQACRGIAVMSRAVGLIGHLIEESRQPTGRELWRRVDDEASAHMKGRFSGE